MSPVDRGPGQAGGPGELGELSEPGAASMIASSGRDHSVWLGSVTFVSDRSGAYDQLLLATYERMMTDGLSACDWLATVTRGAWRAAPPTAS